MSLEFNLKRTLLRLAAALLFLLSSSNVCSAAKKIKYSPYEGRIIRSIRIDVGKIFEDPQPNLLFRTANSLKWSTHQEVVRRELLFKEGEPLKTINLRESARQLRTLRYLRNTSIEVLPVENDMVDIVVHAQDTWTLLPQFSYSSGVGKKTRSAALVESNVAGWGKRLELSYQEDENRTILGTVYEDPRVLGSAYRLLAAFLERSEGREETFFFGEPIRTLLDRQSWFTNTNRADIVGRHFKDASEDFIYRQRSTDFNFRYTLGVGDPEKRITRYTIGYDFIQAAFRQADLQDFEDLGLNPAVVSSDPARLAEDRRYRGPVFTFEHIEPDYISMNYIDRFDRIEDYNLGRDFSAGATLAPAFLGSYNNNLLFSTTGTQGKRFNAESFLRGELGVSSRLDDQSGLSNTLARFELKYYNVLGELWADQTFLGRHTLAASFFVDYGDRLDRDRQLLLGGDNALRGYQARAFAGDKRSAFNLEDRVHLFDNVAQLVSMGAVAFFDAGSATYGQFDDLYGDLYADFGVGLRFAFPRSSGGQVVRVDLGFPLRSAGDGTQAFELRVIFAGGQLFNSRLRSETVGPEKANVSIGVER